MLAIVIPYYKITFFEETLESLQHQTNKEFRVYIGNDASPEDPKVLIESYQPSLDIKYKRYDTNVGSSSLVGQWDRCIDMTGKEEWVMILGDDDMLSENFVETFYKELPDFKDKTNLVRFASRIIDEKKNVTSEVFKHPKWEHPATAFFRRFKGETRSSLSEYIFKKDAYLKYGFKDFPLAWHSDDCAWIDFSEGKDLYCINETEVLIRLSDESISGKDDNLEAKSEAKQIFYTYMLRHKLSMFTIPQRRFLLEAYENTIKRKRKLSLAEWRFLGDKYLKYTDGNSIKKFLKRKLRAQLNSK